MNDRPIDLPDRRLVVKELVLLRQKGIVALDGLDVPALAQLIRATGQGDADRPVSSFQIEAEIRRAIDDLGEGRLGETLSLLFGLSPGVRADSTAQLRTDAADRWGVDVETFRRQPQTRCITQLAETMLRRAWQHHQRLAHLDLERRLPTTSRLAINWLHRFEAYYAMWTPISGLAGDLSAYRMTLLEEGRPYDREPGTEGPDDPGYSQEIQAAGYVTTALWHYMTFLVELNRFQRRYGGLWLLSDERAEQDVSNAVYLIRWHGSNNERDDSYFRIMHERAGGELDTFRNLLISDSIADATETEWMKWAAQCECIWDVITESDTEQYPTHRHHPGINPKCSMHSVIAACNDFCVLVDDDWKRIADWYRIPSTRPPTINDRQLYEDLRAPTP